MKMTSLEKTANRIANAFTKNKIIAPLPSKYTKKLFEAQKLRILAESKINKTKNLCFKKVFFKNAS